MEETPSRSGRAIQLGLLLEAQPHLSLKKAAEQIGIKRAWAAKVLETLRGEFRVQIQYDRPAKLWRVRDRGLLPPSVLSREDVEAMMLTLDEIQVRTDGLLAPRALDAVRRLGRQVLGEEYGEVLKRTMRLGTGALSQTEGSIYDLLRHAVAERRRLHLTYDSAASGSVQRFYADPLRLFFAEAVGSGRTP